MQYAGYNVKINQLVSLPNINDSALYYFIGLLVTDGHMRADKSPIK